MTGTDELVVRQHGPLSVVELNRPEARNALTVSMLRGIGAAARSAENDTATRVLVLTGRGDRAFCAGMDLQAFADGANFDARDEVLAAYHRLASGELAVPVVGAANGSAVGGGLELLLGADLIVASTEAKFGFPETKRGLFPGGGGTSISTRIPLSIALEMTMTGAPITASRAFEVGLVNAVVPPEEVLPTAFGLAQQIADNAPLAVDACKQLVRLAVTDTAQAADLLDHWQKTVFGSQDAVEGAQAFLQKRSPIWQGR